MRHLPVLLLSALLVVLVHVGWPATWNAEEDENGDQAELEAVQSTELERLLRNGRDVAEYGKTVTDEVLLSSLAAALLSDDFDVRFGAIRYLLSDGPLHEARILPFIQQLGQKMVDNYLKDTYETAECWWPLVRLLGRYPDVDSVPILLFAAEYRHKRIGGVRRIVGNTVIRNSVDFFDDIAESLKACTGGRIGEIPEGIRWWNTEPQRNLLAEWQEWWEENKPEREEAGDTTSSAEAAEEGGEDDS